jgi:hypothetical protein
MQLICKYPKCPGTDKHAYAVAHARGRRDAIPVCGECVAVFARRRENGEPIRIIWL